MPDLVTIDLMRHGVTTAGSCFLGATDAPLTDQGWKQMQLSVGCQCYEQVISSPLIRCEAFAKRYMEENNIPLHIDNDLREINFGAWEGRTSAEVWETQQQQLSAFWSDPVKNTPPDGEPFRVFEQRVNDAFKRLLDRSKGENLLVVAHGGVIRQIISSILCLSFEKLYCLHIDYAGLTRIEYCNGDLSLRFINQRVQG